MDDELFNNPDAVFLIVSTVITILILLSRLFFKRCTLLWKSTLISYIVFIIFMLLAQVYQRVSFASIPLFEIPYHIFSAILAVPGMLVYGLFPGAVKPCPSDFDEFGIYTCAFLFYAIVIWGIMKLVKKRKETKAISEKKDNILEKQTPTENEA